MEEVKRTVVPHRLRGVRPPLAGMIVAVLGSVAFGTGRNAAASPMGQAAAEQVSEASYRYFIGDDLSVPGILYTHFGDNRGPDGPEHDPAQTSIISELESYGLAVTLEPFDYSSEIHYNVVATKLGTAHPDQAYILGAHCDSTNNPGADENASGVALLLEAARIISQYDSEYTICFIVFDMEEQGLVGSDAYVDAHYPEDILGMVSADRVAYDTDTDHACLFGQAASTPIKAAIGEAIGMYGGGLTYADCGQDEQSSHTPFEAAGYQACLLIEGEFASNARHHTQQDSVDAPGYIDYAYAVRMTRSIVGFLVDHAGVTGLAFSFPYGRPELINPAGGTTLHVEVGSAGMTPQPDTALLHYDAGSGFVTLPMEQIAPSVYEAEFPAFECGQEMFYYVSAETTGGVVTTSPATVPAASYSAFAAIDRIVVFEEDFESDQGWIAGNLGATGGDWQRGIPVNDPGWDYDPALDSDGSGRCYLTENGFGNTDVDGGAVRLTTPTLDMSTGSITIGYDYFLRLTNAEGGADRLLVEINSNDGVGAWTEIARHDTDGGLLWHHHDIDQADLAAAEVSLTSTMRVRFTANDGDPQSIVEAGLDAFSVVTLVCSSAADGDMDADDDTDGLDIRLFVDAILGNPSPSDVIHGDFTGDSELDADDVPGMVSALLASPAS